MKKIFTLLLVLTLIFTFTACSGKAITSTDTVFASQSTTGAETESVTTVDAQQAPESTSSAVSITPSPISVEYDSDDLDSSTGNSDMTAITLNGDTVAVDGSGVTVNGTIVTITSAGTYSISGASDNNQIKVDTEDEEKVVLILNGAAIAYATSAPIYVVNAEKTVITLASGTENYVTDGDAYVLEDTASDEPNAAIFSNDDLTLNGDGSLTVNANYNNGIASKDDLKITGGTITVNAVNDGIKGRDSIAVRDGVITINAGGDGMQANNDEDAEKGYVSIEGGALTITAEMDGIQAETSLLVSDGTLSLVSGDGSVNGVSQTNWGGPRMGNTTTDSDTTDSTKGLKAGVDVTITGGTIYIDSADDAVHSNNSLSIDGGSLILATGDDGIHADNTLNINGGDVTITESYEGIESATITLNAGTIRLVSNDDGINASSGTGGGAMWQQGPGFKSGDNSLYINGGYIAVDAMGDGLDINGPIEMTGGVVIVNGPVSNGNGALDYAGTFNVTGGFLIAVGSAGMAQAPSASSSQYSVMVNLPTPQTADTPVHIETATGEEILTFLPTKEYQSVVLSSPDLENSATYVVYTGGSATGAVSDGLYTNAGYTAGTQVDNFTISSMVTGAGSYGGGMPGGNMPRPGNRRRP